jgi:SAM-dependent methyltransferase|tara:strand:+ start:115 stop:912 length:798 start_codon:yes stop_codon:yes gene_type:complete
MTGDLFETISMRKKLWGRVTDEISYWFRPNWTIADVAQHWDRVEDYDDINEETHSYYRRFVDGLRLSDIPGGARILDLCSRTGKGTLHFHQNGKVGSAVCADVSPKMGELCKRRLEKNGVESFVWIQILGYSLPFADCEFDAILCFETVEHFSEPERLLIELGRVTRSGGTLILTTPNVLWEPIHGLAAIMGVHHSEGPHRFIRYHRLLDMVIGAGFEVERAETSVLVPAGPALLVRLGDWVEKRTKRSLMPWLGLRRVLVCRKL